MWLVKSKVYTLDSHTRHAHASNRYGHRAHKPTSHTWYLSSLHLCTRSTYKGKVSSKQFWAFSKYFWFPPYEPATTGNQDVTRGSAPKVLNVWRQRWERTLQHRKCSHFVNHTWHRRPRCKRLSPGEAWSQLQEVIRCLSISRGKLLLYV